mgnify:CR=1 FL=1
MIYLINKLRMLSILTCLLIGVNSTSAVAGETRILPAPKKISEHVYAWIGPYGGPNTDNKGYRMNLAFVVGDDAVAVLDSGFYPQMAEEMLMHIRKITNKPIKYVINSNSQADRFFGNSVFKKQGANIYAHAIELQRMKENSSNYMAFIENSMKFKEDSVKPPTLPDHPIEKMTSIDLGGGVELKIEHHKAAHTPMPLIMHIPVDNVVYAGDILYSGRLLAITNGGNIKQWMETVNYLKRFDRARFIPGHGEPGPLSSFQKSTYDYLALLNTGMAKMVDEGIDMQDAIDKLDQSGFSYLENFEDLAGRNANRAYQEAESAAFD